MIGIAPALDFSVLLVPNYSRQTSLQVSMSASSNGHWSHRFTMIASGVAEAPHRPAFTESKVTLHMTFISRSRQGSSAISSSVSRRFAPASKNLHGLLPAGVIVILWRKSGAYPSFCCLSSEVYPLSAQPTLARALLEFGVQPGQTSGSLVVLLSEILS